MRPERRIGYRLQQNARRLQRWLFPERIEPPPEAMRVLRAVFPTLDLGAVSFHRGIPHLIRRLGSAAIVLPHLLVSRRTCVYVRPGAWRPESVKGLGTLVHETYHALQAQEAGWGCGPLRPFLMLYLAYGAANGFRYVGHPMESDAYDLAGRRWSRFETAFPRVDDLQGLATPSSGVRFWRGLARSLPFAPFTLPLLPLWLLVWVGVVFIFWTARLLVEGTGAAVAFLLWWSGALVSCLEEFPSRHS